jgi:hypothetical protein
MNQAAKYFLLQTVENGSWVGMVHFNSTASIESELIQIKGNTERNTLLEELPSVADGGTSICSGIQAAFQVKIMLQTHFVLFSFSGHFIVKWDCSYLIYNFNIIKNKGHGTQHIEKSSLDFEWISVGE